MNYIIELMGKEDANQISKWKYEEPYSMYSMDGSDENIRELLDGSYYVVKNDKGEVFGYFCFGENAQVPEGNKYNVYCGNDVIDIGLGIKPEITGQGKGVGFFKKGLEFTEKKFSINKIRLTVAVFNKRVIKTYEKVGFKKDKIFKRKRGNNIIEFITMKYGY